MNDDVVRLSVVGRILRRRWRHLAAYALLGALVGAGCSLVFSPGYESASTVLLQGPREKDQLLTETQIATSSVVLDRTARVLGGDSSGTGLRDSVKASAVEGNLLVITGTAATPAQAQRLADEVAEQYVMYSTQLATDPRAASAEALVEQRDSLRQKVVDTNESIAALHRAATRGSLTVESVQTRTELEALRIALASAVQRLTEAESLSSGANMVIMGAAALPTGKAAPTMVHFVVAGAALGLLLGTFGHLAAARADRRLRNGPDVAAALGAPVLGSVDVVEPAAPGRQAGWFGRRRGKQQEPARDGATETTDPLGLPATDISRLLRYQRILSRLRATTDGALRLVVVVADDDIIARRAVATLAMAAGMDIAHRTELRVAHVDAARPVIPDHPDASGALVVLTAGTRTGWEVIGFTEACADAGYPVVGAVISRRADAADGLASLPEFAALEAAQPSRNGQAMAGSK